MESLEFAFHGSVHLLLIGLIIPLSVLLLLGLVLAVLQSATQIQEQLLTFFPKVLLGALFIYLGGSQFTGMMVEYLQNMVMIIPQVK